MYSLFSFLLINGRWGDCRSKVDLIGFVVCGFVVLLDLYFNSWGFMWFLFCCFVCKFVIGNVNLFV